jgi:hypothetical protein
VGQILRKRENIFQDWFAACSFYPLEVLHCNAYHDLLPPQNNHFITKSLLIF